MTFSSISCRTLIYINSIIEEPTILEVEFVSLHHSSSAVKPNLFVGSGILCECCSDFFFLISSVRQPKTSTAYEGTAFIFGELCAKHRLLHMHGSV